MTVGFHLNYPLNTPQRKLKVICVGAGAGGLLVAYKLQRNFGDFELTVYEKNSDIGGTWFENKYPGCACDIPAQIYTYSFEPKTDWNSKLAGSEEIHGYFKNFANKYDLWKYIKLNSRVEGAVYDEEKAIWNVEVESEGKIVNDWCHIFINARGILNSWRWPNIEGLSSYKGILRHSAIWDPKTDLKGKTVGLVGNGSSAIQILPTILPDVEKLVTFVRNPTWVVPGRGIVPSAFEEDADRLTYTEEEKEEFAANPKKHLEMRKKFEIELNLSYRMFLKGSQEQAALWETAVKSMKEKLNNEELEKLLIPKFNVGTRRLTPGPGYVESLTHEKVTVVYGELERITETGVVSAANGNTYDVDVLILATGFDTSYTPRFKVQGRKGQLLSETWRDVPEAYLGYAVDGFPNYFMILGPNCPISSGSLLGAMEVHVDMIVQMLAKFQKENLKSLEVHAGAVRDFNEYKDKFMESLIWSEKGVSTWYKGGADKSKVTAIWPGSPLHFREILASPRWEDWNIERYGSRYDFFGNGFATVEVNNLDLAYYLTNEDETPIDLALKPLN